LPRTYKFSILSPGGKTFEGEVEHVGAPGAKGRFGVLPGHAPMIAIVEPGLCLVRVSGTTRPFYTGEGVLEVSRDEVVMLVDEAEPLESPDDAKARVAERKRSLAGGKRP
jgi:F-type H+-transporting ATPase subunit epsilon